MRAPFRKALLLFVAASVTAAGGWMQNPAPSPAPQAPPPAAPAGGGRGAPVRSPEIGPDRRVTFRLRAPNAREVVVAVGQTKLSLQKDEQGVWSGTTEPLAPEIYTYSMIVDGTTIVDPSNRQFQTSFGSHQAMFSVPGSAPWLPQPGVARGAVARHTYRSAVASDEREFFVYTPPGYSPQRSRPYPVLYILHGLGDDAERWMNGGAANVILDNLIAKGEAVPMVMVAPLGYGTSLGPAGGRGAQNLVGSSRALLDEVMPAVDRAYHVSRNRTERAIAGLSMGGAEALYVGLNHLETFASIASFSGALLLFPPAFDGAPARGAGGGGRGAGPAPLDSAVFDRTFPALSARSNAQIQLLWIVCGTADSLIGQNRQFKTWLTSKGVTFTEQEVPDIGHVWPLWRQNLADLAPRLFRPTRN
jgi:enterochelin esterase family protein